MAFFFASSLERFNLTDHAVFQNSQVIEQVKTLEHHAYLGAVSRDIHALIGDVFLMIEDFSGGRSLQHVDAAQQRRFTGTGRADNTGYISGVYCKVNVTQDNMLAEGFA